MFNYQLNEGTHFFDIKYKNHESLLFGKEAVNPMAVEKDDLPLEKDNYMDLDASRAQKKIKKNSSDVFN